MNGIETTGLIDTGSEISTVSEQFWNSLNPKPEIHVVQELEIKCAMETLCHTEESLS